MLYRTKTVGKKSNPLTYPEFGTKKSENNGLNETKNFFKILKGKHPCPPKPYVQLMRALCSSSSTTSLFQPYEPGFCKKLMKHMDEKNDIFTPEFLSVSTKMKEIYPHFYELYEDMDFSEKFLLMLLVCMKVHLSEAKTTMKNRRERKYMDSFNPVFR